MVCAHILFSVVHYKPSLLLHPCLFFVYLPLTQTHTFFLSTAQALGYKIGAIINRSSTTFQGKAGVSVSFERLEQLGQFFVMLRGSERHAVAEMGRALGLEGSYVNKTFIEVYQEKFRQQAAVGSTPASAAGAAAAASAGTKAAAATAPAPAASAAAVGTGGVQPPQARL